MKQISVLFAFLLIMVSCDPPEPQPEPLTPIEQKIKYLSRILFSESTNVAASCTWDSQNRLSTYHTELQDLNDMTFHYDSLNRVSKIDCYYWEYGYGYYLLYWADEEKLDYADFYINKKRPPFFDSTYRFESKYTYTYDTRNRCTQIHREGGWNIKFHLEWENNNITKLYEIFSGDTSFYINSAYDNNPSIFSAFPKIPIMMFNGLAYNPSQNNTVRWYDYDEDGYPIRFYISDGAGGRRLLNVYEYK